METALGRFLACWEDLDDRRNGNAALHDFHEFLIIALCAVRAADRARAIWRE